MLRMIKTFCVLFILAPFSMQAGEAKSLRAKKKGTKDVPKEVQPLKDLCADWSIERMMDYLSKGLLSPKDLLHAMMNRQFTCEGAPMTPLMWLVRFAEREGNFELLKTWLRDSRVQV